MEAYKTLLKSGYWMPFMASCLCEARQKQHRFGGQFLRKFPINDLLLMRKINKQL